MRGVIWALHATPRPAKRRDWRSRAATTCSRSTAEAGDRWSRRACADGRPTATVTSMRSSSGPLSRRWWRERSAAEQRQRWSPRPHGHGFEAATSMQRVGNSITRWERTITIRPSSSGWRSASSDERANSDSSSRNSTPWWASVTSPGAGWAPPPTRPDGEIVWCGARNGRAVDEPAARVQAGDRVDARDLDRLGAAERRQDRRDPAREHRLARARRAVEEEVVAAGRGDDDRRQQRVVAADVGEVGRVDAAASPALRRELGQRRDLRRAGEDVDGVVQASRRRSPRSPRRAPPRAPATPAPSPAAIPCAAAPCATASAPRIGRSSPVSDSSPASAQSATASGSTWPLAARIAIASGRSKPGPILRR